METIDGIMIGKPLAGLLFGEPFMVCAFHMKELPEEAREEIEEGIDPKQITLARYVPIDNWWDEIIEATYKDLAKRRARGDISLPE